MPSADFCPAVRLPFDRLSPLRTQSRSPGVSSAAFRAQSPNLRFAPLMDMDFAVSRPLVRRLRLISGFCPSTRTFAPRFLQTSPRGDSPCVITSPSPPSGWAEDFHLQAAEHAQHTTKPLRGILLRAGFDWARGYVFQRRDAEASGRARRKPSVTSESENAEEAEFPGAIAARDSWSADAL